MKRDLAPRFSVIIPTFRRRETVVASVRALADQTFPAAFEVIVVVDGSDDGTAEALRALDLPFPLTVIEQPNRGAASARNRGAAEASGEILLFLDDDMEAAPDLLSAHDASHLAGADAVLGHIPVHPASPTNFLTEAIGAWVEDRARLVAARHGELTLFDLLTGQLSVRRDLFNSLGGFDTSFTRGGTYGGEDLDFGVRLQAAGGRIVFEPRAISHQRYVVSFSQHLQQWRAAGRADVALVRKHPEIAAALLELHRANEPVARFIFRPLAALPIIGPIAGRAAEAIGAATADRWPRGRLARRLFFAARRLLYWRGVVEGGGIRLGRSLRVLAYHSVSKRPGEGALAEYVLEPSDFARQIDLLRRTGFTFVSARQALAFLRGGGALPGRAVLVTFDDGYADLLEEAAPILQRHGIPALVFVVTGLVGRTNQWDHVEGAEPRPLLTKSELRELEARGIQIGAHSRLHRSLPGLSDDALVHEVHGALSDLAAEGLSELRLFCYPYGDIDPAVEERMRSAGVQAAFTTRSGVARPGVNPLRVPRIEILRSDGTGLRFAWKVFSGGSRLPTPSRLARKLQSLQSRGLMRKMRFGPIGAKGRPSL